MSVKGAARQLNDLFAFLISSMSSYLSEISRVDPNHTKKRIPEVTSHRTIIAGEYDLIRDPMLILIGSEKKEFQFKRFVFFF